MRLCIPLTVLVVLHPEFAAIRPSFSLDYCSWHATHIVLVEVTPRDRIFRVIESWKGELQPEELIAVPELTPASGAIPISRYLQRTDVFVPDDVASEQIAAQPAGSRMVLFLKSEEDSESSLTRTIAKSGQKWRSADFFNEIKTSVVWIDAGQLYRFLQVMNPGPSILVPWDISLKATSFHALPTIPLSLFCVSARPGTVHYSPFERADCRTDT